MRSINNNNVEDQTERYCWNCHRETPHGRVHSLSSTPYARTPQLEPVIPGWSKKFTSSEKYQERGHIPPELRPDGIKKLFELVL